MKIIVCKDYNEVSQKAAALVIRAMVINPELKLGLATGSSPIGLYENLINAYKKDIISFEEVTTFNLDEYVGIDRLHPQSYYSFMFENLFKHVDIKEENINIPNNDINKIDDLAAEYDKKLLGNQRDLQILGIGKNGHIGFNEPGTNLNKETFIVELDEQTRNDNSRFFGSLEAVPKFAITMGIKNIMYSKKIILIASGKNKADVINKAINDEITEELPASILQLHPDLTLVIDEDAASMIDNLDFLNRL
jgi:glucosamine-6-phosphate deaminase